MLYFAPMKAYKYKLKPSARIVAVFEMWLQLLCELYNAALQERRDAWRMNHVSIGKKEQSAQLPAIKKERADFARIHSQVLQETINRVDLAFQNFFRRVKQGQTPGFPRFRSHRRYDSFTYPQSGFRLDQKARKLYLSKIGSVKVHLSRLIEGTIKTCSIKREADGWYVIFAVEEVPAVVALAPEETVGIDVGLKTFGALSTGEQIDNPRFLRHGEAELKTAQRRVSRRAKGSARRKKAVQLLARKHQHVARQRRDFHFKEAKKIAVRFRLIKFEDLQIRNMAKNRHLAKSISDAGWSQFISIVVHKAEEAGGRVEVVNAAGTSTRCSRCGRHQKMPLNVRIYRCGGCGLVIDRDHNSGINIKERKGRTVLSSRRSVATVEEARTSRATDPESPTKARSGA